MIVSKPTQEKFASEKNYVFINEYVYGYSKLKGEICRYIINTEMLPLNL